MPCVWFVTKSFFNELMKTGVHDNAQFAENLQSILEVVFDR